MFKVTRLCVVALAFGTPTLGLAQSKGGDFTLRKAVTAGGVVAQGGSYRLTATAALPAAVQSGGSYRLISGFHAPRSRAERLFCDGFETSSCP